MHNLFHLFILIHNFYLLKLSIIQEKKKKKKKKRFIFITLRI